MSSSGAAARQSRPLGLEAEVPQAFVAIWQQVTLMAQSVAERGLDSQRQVLAEKREALGTGSPRPPGSDPGAAGDRRGC
ncbi:hypothetical protein [Pseudomonas sp. UM16]|uniref:hypothetical protein n=1 Tax=Pseudomonas sp. UM16 TaxID=3158962 RepID=UPI00398FCAF2